MRRQFRTLVLAASLFHLPAHATVTYFSPRSQSVNVAREMVGWQQYINLCDACDYYGAVSLTGEFTQTFRPGNIAQCLFGTDVSCDSQCGACIKVSGSQVANRGANDWLADYFGLPTDFESVLTFKPRIRNFIADINFYLGLNECMNGLYFRAHFPIVSTRSTLRFNEFVLQEGVNDYDQGYFNGNSSIDRSALFNSASEFFSGDDTPDLTAGGSDCLSPLVSFQPLQCGKFFIDDCNCRSFRKTRLSDIEFALGWNFWCCEDDYLVGLSLRASAPTGNKPSGEYLFEPIVGSGGHWKLGVGLNAQWTFWRNECEDSSFGFFLDAHIQHLFKACQTRCFDLCGKPNSRYMLAQRLRAIDTTATSPAARLGGAANAGYEFAGEFAPVANLTSFNVDVSAAVEADIALKFAYMNDCWEFDLGYNFWGRSCERLCKRNCGISSFQEKTWALKGDAFVVGFNTDCVRLAATESEATINAGTNLDRPFTGTNPLIDNRVAAVNALGAPVVSFTGDQTGTSNPVVFIKEEDVNVAGTKGISNKLFANLSRSWEDCCGWTPFLGIGGEVEFGTRDCDDSCDTSCDIGTSSTSCITACNTSSKTSCNTSCSPCDSSNKCCERCALSQWGIWIKGGVAFN